MPVDEIVYTVDGDEITLTVNEVPEVIDEATDAPKRGRRGGRRGKPPRKGGPKSPKPPENTRFISAVFRPNSTIAPTFLVGDAGAKGRLSSRTVGTAICNGLTLSRLSPDKLRLTFSCAGGEVELPGGFWQFFALGTIRNKQGEVHGTLALQEEPSKPAEPDPGQPSGGDPGEPSET
jgi:hypothetical protein